MAAITHINFGNNLGVTDEGDGVIRVDANAGYVVPDPLPEIPAEPTAQDITDALVALGLATQAEA